MLCKSRFSRTIMSQNSHELSGFNVQVYIIDSTLRVLHVTIFIILEIVKSQLERLDNSHNIFVLVFVFTVHFILRKCTLQSTDSNYFLLLFPFCFSNILFSQASSVAASPVNSSIRAQISSLPCFVSAEKGMMMPSLLSFSPSLIALIFF